MKNILFLFSISLSVCLLSCGRRDNVTTDIAGLKLSNDTVFFDTVFTTIGSATEVFLMKNSSNDVLRIDEVRLAGGESSIYRLNLDGVSGHQFKDVELRPNDSFFLFVDVTVDPNDENQPFVVKDSVVFKTDNGQNDVKLIAWGQNAYFHRSEIIIENTIWPNDKPHVLFGECSVFGGAKLTIQPNTSIHGHSFSRLNIWRKSSISAIGSMDEPIVFQGDRLNQDFDDKPGQWIGIRIRPGAVDNEFRNVTIKNGFIGLQVDSMLEDRTPNVIFQNGTITTMNLYNILCFNANIVVTNSEISNSCGYLFSAQFGGQYLFDFCTMASLNCTRSSGSVFISNADFVDFQNNVYINPLQSVFRNCIVYGNQDEELEFNLSGKGEVTGLVFDHCMLKTEFEEFDANNNIVNQDPLFVSAGNLNYQLDTLSPAIGKAATIDGILFDRNNIVRDTKTPDIGAYEREE